MLETEKKVQPYGPVFTRYGVEGKRESGGGGGGGEDEPTPTPGPSPGSATIKKNKCMR